MGNYVSVGTTKINANRRKTKTKNQQLLTKIEPRNMAAVNNVVSLYKDLKLEWGKPGKNLKKCGTLLDQLKVKYN